MEGEKRRWQMRGGYEEMSRRGEGKEEELGKGRRKAVGGEGRQWRGKGWRRRVMGGKEEG